MNFPEQVLLSIKDRLTNFSWVILDILSQSNDISLVNLMTLTQLKQSKFYAELARLDGAALIDQHKDEKDSRQKIVTINSNGLAILKLRD